MPILGYGIQAIIIFRSVILTDSSDTKVFFNLRLSERLHFNTLHRFKLVSTIQTQRANIVQFHYQQNMSGLATAFYISARFNAFPLPHLDQIVDSELGAAPTAVAGAGAVGAVVGGCGVGGVELGAGAGVIVAEAPQTARSMG
jgi:hypothetical protein